VADLLLWTLVAVRHDARHLIADLQASDGSERTVYLPAGLMAVLGRQSTPLYDGRVKTVSVAYGTGGAWKGSGGAANRATEVRPDLFQGPIPACLLSEAAKPVADLPGHEEAVVPVNPPCPTCGLPTKKKGLFRTREVRYWCRACRKSSGRCVPARMPGPLCPYCGGPSFGHGKNASGVPMRRCKASRSICGKSWTETRKQAAR
jgi:hypothetical protein